MAKSSDQMGDERLGQEDGQCAEKQDGTAKMEETGTGVRAVKIGNLDTERHGD
jgi:hypothetical protein